MFERFTDKARTAVIAARAEAAERGDQIRPVYLLHALAAGDGVAARALAGLGVDAVAIERRLGRAAPLRRPPRRRRRRGAGQHRHRPGRDRAQGRGELRPRRARPVPRAGPGDREDRDDPGGEAVGRAAAREARALRHGYVGTEHLLLGLIGAAQRNPRGDFGPQTLKDLGIDPAQARQRVLDELRRAST